MKKNVVPLVIIALVVAVAATAIFYGLMVSRMDAKAQAAPKPRLVANGNFEKGRVIEAGDFRLGESADAHPGPAKAEDLIGRSLTQDLADGQPFTDRILTKLRRLQLPGGIPSGMRAVTVHIADSSSVVEMLEAGDRVDVQSISQQSRFNAPSLFQVRTVMENVTVYGIGPKVNPGGSSPRAVITLLAPPADAERLVLADAASQLRITLRNRGDQATQPVVTSSFRPASPANWASAAPRQFELLLLEVNGDALQDLQPSAPVPSAAAGDWQSQLTAWQSSRAARLWASSKIDSGQGGEITWRGDDPATSVRIRLDRLSPASNAQITLRVAPEVELGAGSARRGESRLTLAGRETALVSGLVPRDQFSAWRAKFAPGRSPATDASGGELVVLIKPLP